jgi:DNA-binding transcriptional ArsR family regulator
VRRPPELFDRDQEWEDLDAFATQPGPGLRLALVRGRRRQGKSFLLRRLADAAGGFYYQALEEDRGQALSGFGQALGTHLAVPGGRLPFDDWDAVLRAVVQLQGREGGPALVIIDEFPYLLTHSPELPSVLQRILDASRDGGPPVRLIVCGSALSVMAKLLTGAQALRGRATLDVMMRTFDYRDAARFWGIEAAPVAFLVHAVLGGTPGYRDLLPARPPGRVADVARWLAAGPLNPASALFREDDYLLTEQRSLVDRALYHAVVATIAAGNTSQGAIAAALGREQRAVQHPLRALEEAGFVDRHDDVLRSRRPIYRLADPIVRFHHVVTRPDLARFEDRRTAEAWADAQARFASRVLGPHFEDLSRTFAFRFASPGTMGGEISHVGAAVVNDPKGRAQHQIDVVALRAGGIGTAAVAAVGEAKHTTAPCALGALTRLEKVRTLISGRHPDAATAKLLLFSANGFDRNLVRAADPRPDVELIDLDRLYNGR